MGGLPVAGLFGAAAVACVAIDVLTEFNANVWRVSQVVNARTARRLVLATDAVVVVAYLVVLAGVKVHVLHAWSGVVVASIASLLYLSVRTEWAAVRILRHIPNVRDRLILADVLADLDDLGNTRIEGPTPERNGRLEAGLAKLAMIRHSPAREIAQLAGKQAPIWANGAEDWDADMVRREIELYRRCTATWPEYRRPPADTALPADQLAAAFFAYFRLFDALEADGEDEAAQALHDLQACRASGLESFVGAVTKYVALLADRGGGPSEIQASRGAVKEEMDRIWPDVRVFRGA